MKTMSQTLIDQENRIEELQFHEAELVKFVEELQAKLQALENATTFTANDVSAGQVITMEERRSDAADDKVESSEADELKI